MLIKPCGFYHNKARNIQKCAQQLMEEYNGEVPSTIEQLMTLSGVGRKTANVVYSVAFNGQAIAVDTHVLRVSKRLGLAGVDDTVLEVEQKLMKKIPKDRWSKTHHQLVHFGRYKCKSISPFCTDCQLKDICKYYKKVNSKKK